MAQRATELAEKFEKANGEFTRAVESSSAADWQAPCKGEGWSFGVTAHHVAQNHAGIAGLVGAVASGAALPQMTPDLLNGGNAAHAKEHADCTREETLVMLREGGATAAAVVRGLGDDQLGKKASFMGGEMTTDQMVENILIGHVTGHLESLKAAAAK